MKSIFVGFLFLVMSSSAFATEKMSIKYVAYWKGLAYNSKTPTQKRSFLGANMTSFVNSSSCQDIELKENPKTGNLEWYASWSDENVGWFAPSKTIYTLTIVKDKTASLTIRSVVEANGVTTTASDFQAGQFITVFTGATFSANLFGERSYDKIDLTPVVLVKSCK